jgi:hypothetical protein
MTLVHGPILGAFKIRCRTSFPPSPFIFQSHTFNRGGHGYALKKNCRYLISAALRLRQNHGRDGVAKEKEIHISEALSADER